MRTRTWAVTVAAGLVLADASIVTLALPELLHALDTTVEGVAAVIAVYTLALACALLPAERLVRRIGAPRAAVGGFALFAAASVGCAAAGSLPLLLVARGVQAAGGAAGLVAAFELIAGGTQLGRRHWLGAAVMASAVGPALGGALTQAFSWRAIFVAQIPIALAGAAAAASAAKASPASADRAGGGEDARAPGGSPGCAHPEPTGPARHRAGAQARDAAALALVSGALAAVLFGLVLLLVAGWAVEPLAAAVTVTVLPLAALGGAQVRAEPRSRAICGALLIGGGVLALAWLPTASVAWTLPPQALAGVGMGMSLPAFAGELLPERTARQAARLLTIRHAGIALVLIALAPLIAHRLDVVTERAQEQGVALVLDARLPPQDKLTLAPALLGGVEAARPRAGLRRALADNGRIYAGQQRATYATLSHRADGVLVSAVGAAFRLAFVIAGALALVAAAALALGRRPANADRAGGGEDARPPAGRPVGAHPEPSGPARHAARATAIALAAAIAAALPIAYAALHAHDQPSPVVLANPCQPRRLPDTGGIAGFIQDRALQALDVAACRYGSTREELVLALASDRAARRFKARHGVDPRSVTSLLQGLLNP
ncbi:MAG TPA: MFS transporter [Conexibacter sp.]|nr:MFS transporter [Conexibacter sp.]